MMNSRAILLGTFCTMFALNAYADGSVGDYQDFKNSLNKNTALTIIWTFRF